MADREQYGRRGVERQVVARGGGCGRASRDRTEVLDSEHGGHQRADQADADKPEGTVDEIWKAVRV